MFPKAIEVEKMRQGIDAPCLSPSIALLFDLHESCYQKLPSGPKLQSPDRAENRTGGHDKYVSYFSLYFVVLSYDGCAEIEVGEATARVTMNARLRKDSQARASERSEDFFVARSSCI